MSDEPKYSRKHSAITSGRRLLIGGNSNGAWARRYRDLIAGHVSDLGGRGQLSEGELSLIRRASALECELEVQEAALSRGDPVNLDSFGRLVDRLGRTLQRVGLKRVARPVLSLREQLELEAEAEAEAEEAAEAARNEEESNQ